jgi:hypothetical protein
MDLRKAFDQGMAAGVFLMLGASAVYWFISSWSPEVSIVRTILVTIQFIIGIGVATWLLFRRARLSKTPQV